jgi:hypothetical protein
VASDRQFTTSGGSEQRSPLVVFSASRFASRLPLLLALAFALLAALPLFSNPGFLNTRGIGDSPNLLFRVHQLIAAFSGGEFPARWMPDAAYGYGMPYFTYYASFSTHVAAVLKLYGFSYVNAIKLTQLLALLVAGGGMYAWLRATRLTSVQAALGSAAYTFAPFHLVNLYIRGDSLAELWAMALYPLVLWAAHLCLHAPTFRQALALALAVAVLVCTHNISALNFLPFAGLYILSFQRSAVNHQSSLINHPSFGIVQSLICGLPLLWGLALAAFFWLPALGEASFVQLGDLTQGFFFYGNHFRSADLVQTSLLFDYDGNPFSMGLLQAALAALGLGALLWRAGRRREWPALNTFVILGVALSTFLITPLSQPLWENIPLLAYTQFPWRFLSIQALFTAALTAQAGDWRLEIRDWKLPQSPISNLFALGLALAALLPLRLEFIPLADSDVTAARLNLYEYFTTAIGNTVSSEYLPRAVKPRPFTSDVMLGRAPRLKVLSGAATGERMAKRGSVEQWSVVVTGDSAATVAVPTHYWPGWQAEADGEPVPLRAAPGLGWIMFDLPPGAHIVTLRLGRTPLRLGAEAFSLLALLLPLGAWASRQVRQARKAAITPSPRHPVTLSPRHLVTLSLLVIGFFLFRLNLQSPLSPLPLNADFDTLAFLHHDVVRFGEAGELRAVRYSAERLRRGETLTVQTEWALTRDVEATFRLATPLRDAALPLPFATVALTGPQAEAALPIPPDLPMGLYFVTVELRDACCAYPAFTASGRGRGLIHLAPVIVDDEAAIVAPQPAWADLGALRLMRGTVSWVAGDDLAAQLTWQATAELPASFMLALRVRDAAGEEWGSGGDVQFVRGLYPTTLWRLGEVVTDTMRVTLAGPGEPPGEYQLATTIYDAATLRPLGATSLPFALNRRHPRAGRAAQFTLTPNLAIEKVEFPSPVTQGDDLLLATFYLTGPQPNPPYRARWSLQQGDAPPGALYEAELAPGSPANTWPLDAWLIGKTRLPIPNDLAPGEYALWLQLMDETGAEVGEAVRVGAVTVAGRAREFTAPPVQTLLGATFDGQFKLVGYDFVQTESELRLTLVWQALAQPRGDYKYFVHFFDPATGSIATQFDAVPRSFTYPTTRWVKDEVVTEAVTLALGDVPPGRYQLAVGWYDPVTPDLARLPAFDAQGRLLEDGRVVLPVEVKVGD